jgi:hypothetical protein
VHTSPERDGRPDEALDWLTRLQALTAASGRGRTPPGA